MSEARRLVATRMGDAAAALLDALTDDQRAVACWPFPSDGERHRWYYTPTDHGGLALSAMRPAQQRATLRLVATGLSEAGYVTVATIMGMENVLDAREGWGFSVDRERGRDPGLYYVTVFGDPVTGTWAWRFGGHHVSLHHLVVDGEVVATTPCFLGVDPASAPLLGPHLLRPLGAVEDLGRELVRSLDDEQRAVALLASAPPVDLVTANRPFVADGDGPRSLEQVWRQEFPPGPLLDRLTAMQARTEEAVGLRREHLEALAFTTAAKGLAAGALRVDQQEILRALLDTYVGRIPEPLAEAEAAKYAGDGLLDLHLAWAGGIEPGQPHYYRVQGPRLLAEYDNTQNNTNHVHSVWRDPAGDFGADVLAEHRRRHHHGGGS